MLALAVLLLWESPDELIHSATVSISALRSNATQKTEPTAQTAGSDRLRLGVLLEPEGENRVAIVPNSVTKLGKAGF